MKNTTYDEFWNTHKPELVALIKALIPTIEDDFRCSDDFEDDIPGMQITIAINDDCTDWVYQTGDNSYTGACYGEAYWGVGFIYRDSDPKEIAENLIVELASAIDDWED